MSNRTISDEKEMRRRWDALIADMDRENIDGLFMYSTDRIYSAYLRYVTDCPTSLYPLSGLFSKQGISIVGHGVKGLPLYPPPVEKQEKGQYQYYAGGIRQHDFIKDMIGVPACPTTNYVPEMWPETIAELIRKYGYRRIGLVGLSIIPVAFVNYFSTHMPELELVNATELVDNRKSMKSSYEIGLAEECVWIIDELMAAAPSVMKVGQSVREVGRKLRSLADGFDCMDLNIMLGKHPTMPMFNEWAFTDEEIIQSDDCVELMVEVSSNIGFWGECARVYSMGEPPEELARTVALAFETQDYLANLIVPGAVPSEIFEKYSARLVENGFPPEKRFCCHGQGYDVVETPFIRPENHTPLKENAFIAIHPSMYDPTRRTGCFVCDNYLITKDGAKLMNKTPRNVIRVYNTSVSL
ncbi:MAG: M24 family metallopeptidase [Clostridiales Family XIII bacterium]|jgi:Xaa-Pro aminopeptidase|nr:M24 family metallopeptidase [Clostridiales Family XIII bacterium]